MSSDYEKILNVAFHMIIAQGFSFLSLFLLSHRRCEKKRQSLIDLDGLLLNFLRV